MKIVGITACPTGIAHTYMAQEALEKAGKERGHEIKLETQGAMGPENELTDKDISNADVVLLAVGCAVEGMERFDGKPIINFDVGAAIKHANDAIIACENAI